MKKIYYMLLFVILLLCQSASAERQHWMMSRNAEISEDMMNVITGWSENQEFGNIYPWYKSLVGSSRLTLNDVHLSDGVLVFSFTLESVGDIGENIGSCLHRIKRGGRPPEKGNEAAEGGKANRYKWEWVDESV